MTKRLLGLGAPGDARPTRASRRSGLIVPLARRSESTRSFHSAGRPSQAPIAMVIVRVTICSHVEF
jgi:hypothetical protein